MSDEPELFPLGTRVQYAAALLYLSAAECENGGMDEEATELAKAMVCIGRVLKLIDAKEAKAAGVKAG